jgi:hypothetical protein
MKQQAWMVGQPQQKKAQFDVGDARQSTSSQ